MIEKIENALWKLLLLLFVAVTVASCGSDEPEDSGTAETPSPQPVAEVGRTLLVYMVANNSLGLGTFDGGVEGFDGLDLEEMQFAASKGLLGKNRLLVYHVPRKGDVALKEITSEGEIEVLETYDRDEYSTSSARMSSIFARVKSLAPAKRYGLVLWSHATGWVEDGMEAPPPSPSLLSFGDDSGKKMNVSTLAEVLKDEGFDYVYFDCCFMAGVEVAYELRNVTTTIVGSASELPSRGMPYDLTLGYLMADEPDLNAAAECVFNNYDALSGYERTSTMSVIRTAPMNRLASAVKALMEDAAAPVGVSGIQKFYSRGRYYDLDNYLEALAAGGCEAQLSECRKMISEAVTYSAATPYLWEGLSTQVKIDRHCGLTTNIITGRGEETISNYDYLGWWRDVASTLWTK